MDSTQAKALCADLQGKVLDGWIIEGFLGNGKSAVVVRGTRGGVVAAIKVFHPELIERFGKDVQLERISREKSLIGAEHPNLVKILDGGDCTTTGYLYVAMECLTFKNLREVLQTVPPNAVFKLIAQIASAARFLEDRDLVHRDIKPENIAVSPDFSRAILLDLGVLRPVGISHLTDIDHRPFIGTLQYSSPEFLRRLEAPTKEGGRAITFYQLGAVLHDMVMKKPIFEDYVEPFSELVEAVLNTRPVIFGQDTRSVALAQKCLLKNPLKRIELVDWNDFVDQPPEASATLTALKERLKAKQAYFLADKQSTSMPAAEVNRIARQRLDDLVNRFESRIASLLNDLQCFPLRSTRSAKDAEAQCCRTTVQFEKDESFGLSQHLTIEFTLQLVDENLGVPIYTASSCCALSISELEMNQCGVLKKFFSGEADALLNSSELEQQFVTALGDAYLAKERGLTENLVGILLLSEIESKP